MWYKCIEHVIHECIIPLQYRHNTVYIFHCSEVGDVVGVADSTIRQSYRLLYPDRAQLFPKDFVFSTPLDSLPKH